MRARRMTDGPMNSEKTSSQVNDIGVDAFGDALV